MHSLVNLSGRMYYRVPLRCTPKHSALATTTEYEEDSFHLFVVLKVLYYKCEYSKRIHSSRSYWNLNVFLSIALNILCIRRRKKVTF